MKNKRLLFISSRPLYPVIGGDQIRTVQQLDFLKERFQIDVLYMTSDDNDLEYQNSLKGVNSIIRFKQSTKKAFLQTLRFLFNNLPLQVNYYYNRAIARKIDSILHKYDYVFCNNIRTAEYVREKENIIKCIDFVDAISMNYDKARHKADLLKKLIYEIDYRRCRAYEQKCLKDFDHCAVISDIDKSYILSCQK